MTIQEAIDGLKNLRLLMELEDKTNENKFNSFTYDCVDMAIEALNTVESMKAELKEMKRQAYIFQNQDYATGYISAISTLEEYLAMLENGGYEDGNVGR
jgi:hypothetical protein